MSWGIPNRKYTVEQAKRIKGITMCKKIKIVDATGKKIVIKLDKASSPLTVSRLLRLTPIKSMAIKTIKFLQIPMDLEIGLEKEAKNLSEGHVAYSPMSRALIVALRDMNPSFPMSPIGEVEEGLSEAKAIATGVALTVDKEEGDEGGENLYD